MNKKKYFLKNEFIPLLRSVSPDAKPLWGKMNAQQMIEHLIGSFKEANGKIPREIKTPVENIPKMKAFILSDIPFKENTKNRQLPEDPFPLEHASLEEAISLLEIELNDFFNVFESTPNKIVDNTVFGDLDYEHWVALLYKHTTHHLKQFSINIHT